MNREEMDFEHGDEDILIPVWNYVKQRIGRILAVAVISFGIAALALGAIYFLSPRETVYTQDIWLTLEPAEKGYSYPDGCSFSTADILSTAVLRQVYLTNKLENRLDIADFQNLFNISNISIERSKLDAEYRGKMGKKNISAVDLNALQNEYNSKLEALPKDNFSLVMKSDVNFSEEEAARFLNETAKIWNEKSSAKHAKTFPAIDELRPSPFAQNNLLELDRIRIYADQLGNALKEIKTMPGYNNKLRIATGENSAILQSRLDDLAKFRIELLWGFVMNDTALLTDLDKIFLGKRIASLSADQHQAKRLRAGIMENIAILRGSQEKTGTAVTAFSEKDVPPRMYKEPQTAGTESITMEHQTTPNFLNSYVELSRKAENIDQVKTYIKETEDLNRTLAKLEADLEVYTELLKSMDTAKTAKHNISTKDFVKERTAVFQELNELGQKIQEYILMQKQELAALYFTDGIARKQSISVLPVKHLIAGFVLLWILYNGISLLADFSRWNAKHKESEKAAA